MASTQQSPDDPTDPKADLAHLAARAVAGDTSAFELLFRRLGPAVRRMLLGRVGNDEHRADDLSQRTWAGLWRSLQTGSYDPTRSAITTYVYAVAYRTWLHDMRQRSTGPDQFQAADLSDELTQEADSPEAATNLAHAIDAVRSALGGAEPDLLPEERDMLRALGSGESDRSIAKRLGLAPSTVNVRKQSALAKLKRILARQGFRADSAERESPLR